VRRTAGRAALALGMAWLAACSSPNANPDEVIALQVTAPTANRQIIEQNDTLNIQTMTLWGVALNLAGDSIASVIIWRCADTTAAVPDSFIPYIYGTATSGTARIQANTAGLFSPVLNYSVRARTDTILFAGPDTMRVLSGDDQSAGLNVEVDTYNPAGPLAGRTVIYTITSPVFLTVSARTVEFSNGWLVDTVVTAATGQPATPPVVQRVTGQTSPDSALIVVSSTRPSGRPVPGPGSPFIVRFDP
jgi:hypothetical protein